MMRIAPGRGSLVQIFIQARGSLAPWVGLVTSAIHYGDGLKAGWHLQILPTGCSRWPEGEPRSQIVYDIDYGSEWIVLQE